MSNSSNKTPVYGLNQWELTDKPKMEDFNYDNEQLEIALSGLAETAEENQAAIAANETAIAQMQAAIADLDERLGSGTNPPVNSTKMLSELPVGALVMDPNTKIYDNPIVWQVGDHNHAGYPANSTTLVAANIIKIMCFDGMEAGSSDSDRQTYGNNRYAFANLRQWLNKSGTNWYSAMHGADAPPSLANTNGYNGYDTVAGFLTTFSANMRAALLDTTLTVAKATVDGGGSETVTDKVFLLSKAEVGLGAENGINEGSLLALFNSADSSRIAYPTADAVSGSTFTSPYLATSKGWHYCLRSPYASCSDYVRLVFMDGSESYSNAFIGYYGLRPALNLPSNILVSDSPDANGIYTLAFNA
jgi:hypothetical protein